MQCYLRHVSPERQGNKPFGNVLLKHPCPIRHALLMSKLLLLREGCYAFPHVARSDFYNSVASGFKVLDHLSGKYMTFQPQLLPRVCKFGKNGEPSYQEASLTNCSITSPAAQHPTLSLADSSQR